jgi:magnesium chelatase accessory protein
MMAQWSLDGLLARLPQIDVPVHLITGSNDKAVPPTVSRDAAQRLPQDRLTELPGLGHLAHEENAALIAGLITAK